MGSIDNRLTRLEARGSPEGYSGLAREVRIIDDHIRQLDREIAELEATMSPAEIAEARRGINNERTKDV